ncbi:DMT family transporter [Desulfolucanica intricata]|uniref:DMT family transporter n=1 Tax=Desulfolucanica intricata TaxID=1285191 RepID=UPI00083271EB|nr:multidrug efflux SMR transporter [Desulfolucanica intricata]
MAWTYLLLAGIFEASGVIFINKLHRDKNLQTFLLMFGGFGASFLFLTLAMKTLPMGTAYAVWTGIGASGGAVLGMLLYGESRDRRRLFFITIIIVSAIGLKLVS